MLNVTGHVDTLSWGLGFHMSVSVTSATVSMDIQGSMGYVALVIWGKYPGVLSLGHMVGL